VESRRRDRDTCPRLRQGGRCASAPQLADCTRPCFLALSPHSACVAVSSAAAAPGHVAVFFLRGEQLASVQRPGKTPLDAMRQLIAGPTAAERRQGFRTYLPTNTRVLSANVSNGVAIVDLNERFASGTDPGSLLARLTQIVRTLTGIQGAEERPVPDERWDRGCAVPRYLDEPTDHFRYLQTPNVGVPEPPGLSSRRRTPPSRTCSSS